MTPLQKIQLRKSEIRSRLAEIAGMEGDALNEEARGERDTIMAELTGLEPQERAALVAEGAETRDTRTDDGEGAEFRGLVTRSRLSAFVREAESQATLDGAEGELRAAVFGEHARPGLVPWEMLLPIGGEAADRREEHRQDAATDVTDSAGAEQQTIVGRVFAQSATAYLGVAMPSVARGASAHPVITAGVSPAMKAKGATQNAEAATVSVTTLEPRRLTARYVVRVEDLARIEMLEEALRADMRMALAEEMDAQVIAGDGASPNVEGLLTAIAAPDVPGAVAGFTSYLGVATGAVDGRGARNIMEVRMLSAIDVYQAAGTVLTGTGDTAASDYLLQRSAGFRTTPHIPNAPTAGTRANVGEVLIARTMAPGSAVSPVWAGFQMTIRDEVTKAAAGEIAITSIALWNFKMLRAAGFARASVKLA